MNPNVLGKFQYTARRVISKLYSFAFFQSEINSFVVTQPGGQCVRNVAAESYNLQTDKTTTAHSVHMNTDCRQIL